MNLGSGAITPTIGDQFQFLTATGGVSGGFTSLSLPPTPAGSIWQVRYGATSPTLVVSLPGDFDFDGDVDKDDLAKWKGDVGVNGHSDADMDGDSDGADLAIWQRYLGTTAPMMSVESLAAIPEPTSGILGALARAMLFAVRRDRRD